jgi:hypothetical protein
MFVGVEGEDRETGGRAFTGRFFTIACEKEKGERWERSDLQSDVFSFFTQLSESSQSSEFENLALESEETGGLRLVDFFLYPFP